MGIDAGTWIGRCLIGLGSTALMWAGAAQAVPEIQHWQTDNGARVYYVPAPQLPMVDARLVFDGGAARDGQQPGLASLTNRMLSMGAGDMDANAIARKLAQVGAVVSQGAERDMAWVSLRSLVEPAQLEPAVDIVATMLADPKFPESDFERERSRTLVALEQQKESPSEVAEKTFYKAVFRDHPYAHEPLGTKESVEQLQRRDLMDFHRRYYTAANAVVAIVGDLDRKQAEALAQRLTERLPKGEAAPKLPEVPALEQAVTERIGHPSTQSHLRVGQPGIARGAEDYFPLYVGNHAFGGGGLVSVLNEEVREKRGLSYSVYSYFYPMARSGPFLMAMQTRNEQADEGLEVLRQTLAEFLEQGVTEEQLTAAKQNITGSFPLRIDSNQDMVQYLAMIGFYDLPLDYLQAFNDNVESVTREQVNEAFRSHLSPEKMVTVVVGGEQ